MASTQDSSIPNHESDPSIALTVDEPRRPPPLPTPTRMERFVRWGEQALAFALWVFELPSRLLLRPWNEHLLDDALRAFLAVAGVVLALVGVVDLVAWQGTLKALGAVFSTGAGITITALTLLVDVSMLTRSSDGPRFKRYAKLSVLMVLAIGLRLVTVYHLTHTNGEALVLRVNESEVTAQLDLEKGRIETGIRETAAREVNDDINRRIAEYRASRDRLTTTLTGRENEAAARRQASVEAANARAAEESRGGRFSGRGPGAGPGTTHLGGIAAQQAQAAASENSRGQERITAAERETAAGVARLENERSTRLAAVRASTIQELARQQGASLTVARGPTAQREAYQRHLAAHPSGREQSQRLAWMLIAIGFLPIIMSLFAPRSRRVYFSTAAHAAANDGTPECLRAQVVMAHLDAEDDSIHAWQKAYLEACAKLLGAYRAFWCEYVPKLAQSSESFAHLLAQAELEWTKTVGNAQEAVAALDLEAAQAGLDRPSWPLNRLVSADLRTQPFGLLNADLMQYGWRDLARISAEHQRLTEEAHTLELAIVEFMRDYGSLYADFLANHAPPTHDTRRVWDAHLAPIVGELTRCVEQLHAEGVPFNWLNGEDPRPRARMFNLLPPREKGSQPPSHQAEAEPNLSDAELPRHPSYEDRFPARAGRRTPVRHLHVVPKPQDDGE